MRKTATKPQPAAPSNQIRFNEIHVELERATGRRWDVREVRTQVQAWLDSGCVIDLWSELSDWPRVRRLPLHWPETPGDEPYRLMPAGDSPSGFAKLPVVYGRDGVEAAIAELAEQHSVPQRSDRPVPTRSPGIVVMAALVRVLLIKGGAGKHSVRYWYGDTPNISALMDGVREWVTDCGVAASPWVPDAGEANPPYRKGLGKDGLRAAVTEALELLDLDGTLPEKPGKASR